MLCCRYEELKSLTENRTMVVVPAFETDSLDVAQQAAAGAHYVFVKKLFHAAAHLCLRMYAEPMSSIIAGVTGWVQGLTHEFMLFILAYACAVGAGGKAVAVQLWDGTPRFRYFLEVHTSFARQFSR